MASSLPARTAYVSLSGELDAFTEWKLNEALPDPAEVDNVIINLVRVTHLDSTALGQLVRFRHHFLEAGGQRENLVVILPRSGAARTVFEIAGLSQLFAIAEATGDAV
jgi:anti-anti-sigma factor